MIKINAKQFDKLEFYAVHEADEKVFDSKDSK